MLLFEGVPLRSDENHIIEVRWWYMIVRKENNVFFFINIFSLLTPLSTMYNVFNYTFIKYTFKFTFFFSLETCDKTGK